MTNRYVPTSPGFSPPLDIYDDIGMLLPLREFRS